MAVEDVLLVTVGGDRPVAVAAGDAALVGAVVVDWFASNPSVPEVAVDVRAGVRRT